MKPLKWVVGARDSAANRPPKGSPWHGWSIRFAALVLVSPGVIAVYQNPTLQRALITGAVTLPLVAALPSIFRYSAARVLFCMIVLLVPVVIFYRVLYHGPISPGILLSILSTTPGEASELLAKHAVLTGLLALLPLGILASAVRAGGERPAPSRKATRGLLASALLLFVAWVAVTYVRHGEIHNLGWALKDSARETFPVDVVLAVKILVRGQLETSRATAARSTFKFDDVLSTAPTAADPSLYVVVIGESSRRANWSLYGYERETTPRLGAMRDELVLFDNAIANANITMFSLTLLLTRASPTDWDISYRERSLLTLLRQGGFAVEWISNQDKYGFSENPVSSISVEAEKVSFAGDYASDSTEKKSVVADPFDSNLLPRLEAAIARFRESRRNTVIFLHMMGSHDAYDERYPPDFDFFKDRTPRDGQTSQQRLVVDQYDNSIRFTDFVLSSAIDQVRGLSIPSAVVYLSDHGERLYDAGMRQLRGHGFPVPSREELQIPLLVWLSPALENQRPKVRDLLQARSHLPVQLKNVFETIVDLSELTYRGRDPRTSLLAEDFHAFPSVAVYATTQAPICTSIQSAFAVNSAEQIRWESCH